MLSREYQSNWFWGKCGICVSVLFMWFEGVCFRVETIILEASLTTLWLCSDYQAQVNFLANPDRIQLIWWFLENQTAKYHMKWDFWDLLEWALLMCLSPVTPTALVRFQSIFCVTQHQIQRDGHKSVSALRLDRVNVWRARRLQTYITSIPSYWYHHYHSNACRYVHDVKTQRSLLITCK